MPEQSFTPLTTAALPCSKVVPSRGYMSPAEPPNTCGSSAGANLCLKPNPRRLKGPVWSEHHFNPPLRGISPSTRSREAARGEWCRARDAEKNRFYGPLLGRSLPQAGAGKCGLHSCSVEVFLQSSPSSQHRARGGTGETTTLAGSETSPRLAASSLTHREHLLRVLLIREAQNAGRGQGGFVPRADPLLLAGGRVIGTGAKSGARPRWERCGNVDKAGLFPLRRRVARQERHTNRHN